MYHRTQLRALLVAVARPSRLEGTTVPSSNISYDRKVVLHMLYAACMLIVLGAVVGIAGSKIVDTTTGATLGTAVLGAGAAMLPTGAISAARSASTAGAASNQLVEANEPKRDGG
jgi:uncharacterized membrane protein YeaQ/YmgE (transglycosylase-associated protein family)